MTRICWWGVAVLSRGLERDERQILYGDLAESGETGGQAFCDVLGLVVRRQAALWKGWRPWLALIGLVFPLGLLLCLISRRTADGSAIYLWLYLNNWDWAFLGNAGFRHALVHSFGVIFIQYATLLCWSWAVGFLRGLVARGSIPVHGVLLGLILLFGELPGPLQHLEFHRARDFPVNAAVFELSFYRVVLPLMVQTALVLVPSLWGMRGGLRVSFFRKENHI